ncbi:cardiolipin synthase [Draconibacterium sp. IB214405]|uniref:cardiolipin synthase n=1 Tax=Draconibacterium sp. IB214405 TaxID=3097352 RepID=UPI002A15AAD2|nr:cardiolipin synthase [Draconibacterium sp. IB214405]MDX8341333.1 cardiolipin synthase [Draconibacterium sp. IB214405]
MFDWSQFWNWFYLIFLITAIPVALMIILEKRSPFKTAAWILVLILIPIFGMIFYLVFGQEYRKRKMFSRRGIKSLKELRRLSAEQLKNIDQHKLISQAGLQSESQIIRLLLNNSDSLLTTGNVVHLLKDGQQTFDYIIKAIEKARHHIHMEYYIFANDKIGNKLKDLLIKKRKEGVEVRVIVDDVGSWGLTKRFFKELIANDVEIRPFMEVRFPRFTSRVNYRNHRKIIVIDGKVGFVGGLNIADRYIEGMKGLGHWRDTHLQLNGDAATTLQVIFAADWYFITKQNLYGFRYFPPLSDAPGVPVQISASGPDYSWKSIEQGFFSAIAGAHKKVYLVTPYLMPPQELITALKTAALSQLDVRIIIPEKSDATISKWCSFSYVEELLEAGVRIYFYQNGFIHSKYLLVDDHISSVGTSNFDFRSFETNFEANAFIYQKEFADELEQHFLTDLKNCREIKYQEWHKRSLFFKVRESLAHIISPMF